MSSSSEPNETGYPSGATSTPPAESGGGAPEPETSEDPVASAGAGSDPETWPENHGPGVSGTKSGPADLESAGDLTTTDTEA